jgi:hypothetical protein
MNVGYFAIDKAAHEDVGRIPYHSGELENLVAARMSPLASANGRTGNVFS